MKARKKTTMVLGTTLGRKPVKMRLCSGLTLFTMVAGSLRAAYAGPVAAAAAPPAPPQVAPVRRSERVPTAAPAAMSTRITPVALRALEGPVTSDAVARLFDGQAGRGLALSSAAKIGVQLDAPTYVDALASFGPTDGTVSVEVQGPDGRLQALPRMSLGADGAGWNRHDLAKPVLATALVLTLEPNGLAAVVRELEVWGRPLASAELDPAASLPDLLYTDLPSGSAELPATPAEQTIGTGATFVVKASGVRTFERAFLVYDLSGLPHFTAALRSINDGAPLGGVGVIHGANGGRQVEEIDPASLRDGENRIRFLPVGTGTSAAYQVKHLRLVGVPALGTGLSDASARTWGALRDGRDATGWKSEAGEPGERRVWEFARETQPWALDFRLPARTGGTLTVANGDGRRRSRGELSVHLDGLAAGWHRVPLRHLAAARHLTLTLTSGKRAKAGVSELVVEGSPLPADAAPRLTVTYPLSGECVGHQAHVQGFVSPPDAQALFANGTRLPGALHRDGAFAFDLPGRQAANRTVSVEARYANGARVVQDVGIGACLDRPPPVAGADGTRHQPVDDLGAPFGVVARAGQKTTLTFDGLRLDIPEGAVDHDVRVTVRPLATGAVAGMDAGMTNVTPAGKAYRFGPLGMVFKKPVKLTVPYDRKLIPAGYGPDDIRTYYYDEGQRHWEEVGLVSENDHEMVAASNHFTDFVNATIARPESPGAQSLNPTSMKDMKLGDPAAGITQIQPPTADNGGSAKLSYPIDLPRSRRGVGPSLALSYDSDRTGASGWVGVGWDLPLSAVEIDTRFGVPRYDGSETYLLDGEPLVPIAGSPGFYQRRVEGRFDRIQRLGNDPTSYSWVVTDKNGTKLTYGANLSSSTNSTLADARAATLGNIFKWSLERMEDAVGNFMTVSYVRDTYVNGETFTQIYPQKIQYTGGPSLAPPYEVDFVLDDGTVRPDVTMTGRPGFPVATRRRLNEIQVRLNGSLVRAYELSYLDATHFADTFNKSVLSAVAMRGSDGATELYRHTFDYFTAPPTSAMFDEPQVWGTLAKPNGSERTDDGLSHSDDELFGASGDIGIGFLDIFSATIGGGGDSGSSTPNLLLIDGNGDGLPDQLDKAGFIDLNALAGAAPGAHLGEIAFPGIGGLGHTNRSGWTASGSLSALDGLFGVGGSYSQHTAEDDQVVADMNGDGFPDIVTNNGGSLTVQLNTGFKSFAAPQPWNGYALGGVQFTRQDRWGQANQAGAFFPADPLIRWAAPFAGAVTAQATFQKVKAGGDGVRVDMFVNGGSTPQGSCAFGPNDLGPCTINISPSVAAGDRIYTKTTALNDPGSDELTSSMTVTYNNIPSSVAAQVEPYGAPLYTYDRSADFRLAGLPQLPWTASADGTVNVQGCFTKTATADDITAVVTQMSGQNLVQELDFPVAATSTGTFCIPQLQQPLSVQTDQTLFFSLKSDAQIDPNTVSWPVAISYSSYCRVDPTSHSDVCGTPACSGGFCTIGANDPLSDFPIPQGLVQAPGHVYFPVPVWTPATPGPTLSTTAPATGTTPITWSVTSSAASDLIVMVQGVNKLLAKQHLTTGTASISISPTLQSGEQIFFSVLSPSGTSVQPLSIGAPTVNGSSVPNVVNVLVPDTALDNVNTTMPRDPMSGGYHRWWYGDWNGSRPFNQAQIVVSSNPKKTDSFLFSNPSFGLSSRPDLGALPLWTGRGSGELIAAGRINPGFSASGAATGSGSGVQALRVADTWNVDLQASAVGLSAGVNAGDSTTDIDLFDLNGDKYPDSVTSGAVQYNDGVGSFSSRAPIDMGLAAGGDVRSTTNASLRFGISLGGAGQLINLTNTGSQTKKHVSTDVVSGSTDYGVSSTRIDFVDINGDGLPDHVSHQPGDDGIHVRLNLGYGFGHEMVWPTAAWQKSDIPASILGFDSSALTDALSFVGSIVSSHVTGTDALRFQDTQTNNISVGVPAGDVFGAGGGPNASLSRTIVDFIDLNGDGLPDQVMRAPNEDPTIFRVKLNRGDHFDAETQWSIPNWNVATALPSIDLLNNPDGVSYSTSAGWAASVHVQVCFILCVGGSGFYSRSNGGTNMLFEDVNGDGRADQVLKVEGSGNVYAKLNKSAKTNLLKAVHRPLGSTINIDYQPVGNFVELTQTPQLDMPGNQWVLASATVDDGRSASYTTSFDYSAATSGGLLPVGSRMFDRAEREDRGYARVHQTRTAVDAQGNDISDRSQVDTFYQNQDFYRRKLVQASFDSDSTGAIIRGSSFLYAAPTPSLPVRTGSFFPAEQERRTLFYEKAAGATVASKVAAIQSNQAPSAPKFLRETRQFDTQGNLIDIVDEGDEQVASDNVEYQITYATDPTGAYIVKPSEVDAFPAGNPTALLRKRVATYNPGTGTLAKLTNIVSGGKVPGSGTPGTVYNQASSILTYGYDGFGNLQTFTDPTGYTLQYTYDPTTQTYETRVDDKSFGYFSTASYDFRFGTITQATDVNGQPEKYSYDIFGRLCSVRGPDDQSTSDATITMSYGILPGSCPGGPAAGVAFPPYAVTRHKDVQHAGDPIDTVTFMDGLERVIQTKKDVDRDQNGNGTVVTGMTVSGQVLFDGRGRIKSQAQPGFSTLATTTFVSAGNTSNPSTFTYDEIDRPTTLNVADGTVQGIQTTTLYSILSPTSGDALGDGRTWLFVEQRDGNAPLPPAVSNVGRRLTYSDARRNQVAVREFDQVGTATALTPLTTVYAYDPIDQLLNVTDARGNVTSAVYDTAGRMVTLTSPDAGQSEFRYDLAGNIREKQTPVLRGQSKVITYNYDFDRLKSVTYPSLAPTTYVYGTSAETGDSHGNVAGRIKQVTYEVGNETRTYDHLGNVNKTVTTLNNMSQQTPATVAFTMKYSYDWLGRMQSMTYPNWIDNTLQFIPGEGELVSYFYDHGGTIDRITGFDQTANPQQTSAPRSFTYLNHIGYNEFQQRTVFASGNGIANKYSYDPFTRRLTDISADTFGSLEKQNNKPPTPFHRIHYTFDKVGNITHLVNNVSVQPWRNAAVFVGPLDVTYGYDNLYQLRSLNGKYRPHQAYGYQYSDTFTYDQIGNMLTKAGSQDRLVWDNQTINTGDTNPVVTQLAGSRFDHNVSALTYSLAYQYTSGRPHAPAPITETPVNQTPSAHTYTYDANGNNTGGAFQGNSRVQVWDEENRLKEVDRNGGMLAKFRYDDQGERRKKQTAAGDAWYVNQYFVLLPNNLPTKHIFAGETRIVSKTDAIYMQTPAISYYHPDNLGTTSYTTAANQDLLQHERYFAFGELWRPGAEQEECDLGRPDNLRREYTFTSKEWDVDTSLYYFGARYFDPHADVWQSPDPILRSYMAGGGNAGVYTPQNLGLYSYAYNNPVVLRDPDGHIVDTIADVGFTLFDVGKLIYDEVRGHKENRGVNVAALGADAAAIFIPFVTGAGVAVRVGAHAGEAAHLLEVGAHTADAVKAGEHAVDAVKAGEHTAEAAKAGTELTHTADATKAAEAAPKATTPYKRPSGATTPKQRASVQGKPCAVCGETTPKQIAGHKKALVKEHYETGTIDKERMRSVDAVRPECPTCSNREGAEMSRYSREQKGRLGLE